jgi:protein TonB
MKNPNHKREVRFPFVQRFLTGLIIALTLSLTAFEWTSVKINPDIPEVEMDSTYFDDDLILPPITYRKEKIRELKPKAPTPEILIVKVPTPNVTDPKIDEPTKNSISPNDNTNEVEFIEYGEEIYVKTVADRVHTTVELFAHYNKCAKLRGDELQACSELGIVNEIKRRFKVTEQMKSIGGKQAALMSFVIDRNGNISNIKTIQSQNKYVAKAAKKAIESLLQMNPAIQQGRAVALRVQIPIVVRME